MRKFLSVLVVLLAFILFTGIAFCGEIHDAAGQGDLAKVKMLLNSNPNLVNEKDKHGLTPLHLAAWEGHKDVAELLISKGANVNAKCKDGSTPLHFAAMFGHKDIAALLISKGADVNIEDTFGYTPLHLAIEADSKDVAELLRAHGAKE